jgi:hypothetical protein
MMEYWKSGQKIYTPSPLLTILRLDKARLAVDSVLYQMVGNMWNIVSGLTGHSSNSFCWLDDAISLLVELRMWNYENR